MRAWKPVNKNEHCPLCGADSWCTRSGDGAFMCQKMHGAEVAGWWIVTGVESELPAKVVDRIRAKGQRFTRSGTIYRAEGDHAVRIISEKEIEANRIKAQAKSASERAKVMKWMDKAITDHAAAIAYFRGRGVAVEELPGGRLPRSILCTAIKSGDRQPLIEDKARWVDTPAGAVIVAVASGPRGEQWAAQRIYITPEGAKRDRAIDGSEVDCKLTVGQPIVSDPTIEGAAVRLAEGYGSEGVLILVEGVETGLAVQAAVGSRAVVWSCLSTAGLRAATLDDGATMAMAGGTLKRVIIAGDHDRVPKHPAPPQRPGQAAAECAAARIKRLWPLLEVAVVLPTSRWTDLVGPDGQMEGKSVDWLDVYVQHGAAVVREAMLGPVVEAWAAPVPPSAAEKTRDGGGADVGGGMVGGDGEDRPLRLIPTDPLERARLALMELFAPPALEPGRSFRVRRWDEQWWRHDGVKYCGVGEESMRAAIMPWLSSFYTMKPVMGDDGRKERVPVRFVPKDATVTEVVNYMKSDTLVEADRMPTWIGTQFADGGPVWSQPLAESGRPWKRVLATKEAVREGLPDPLETIVWANGVMDLRAWLDGTVRLLPHSERLFTATALPYDCPVDELRMVGEDPEAMDELIGRLAPTWVEFLGLVSDGDPEWEQLLAQFCGYCLTPWTRHEVILVMTGASRAGKGTIMNGGLTSLVGEDNVASSSPAAILDKFHLHTLIGKNLAIMPDADVGRSTDAILAAETIKKISGGDPVYADRKHKDPLPAVRLTCKIVIMCNRMPSLPDPSGALANRFRVLHFEESAAGREEMRFKDPAVMEREAVGRMLWAMRGLRLLARMEKFVQPVKGSEVLDEYRDYSDPLRKFRDDCLHRVDGAFTAATELYTVWKRWCGVVGREPKSHDWFCMQLRTACPWIRRRQQRRTDDTRVWGYEGLTIVNSMPDGQPTVW